VKRENRVRWVLLGALILIAATTVVLQVGRSGEREEPLAPLRDTLRVLRTTVESCQDSLTWNTSRLQADRERLDSLRARVRALEAMDPRGVPADSYATYLEIFDRYNDSVDSWTAEADTLDRKWTRCRDLTETHNELTDSLHRALVRQLEEARADTI
jgi:DNA repair ATPase RecN